LETVNSLRSRAIAGAILVGAVIVVACDGGTGSTLATPTMASSSSSASLSPSSSPPSVFDDRFGFVFYEGDARVRTESSASVISAYPAWGRSFVSLSRVASPDGRSIAYWDPVDKGAVLNVRAVVGGTPRPVLRTQSDMSGNAFTWSSDGTGLVAAIDNNCQEICPRPSVSELWTIDLASGATERIASGKIWLPIAWDRAAKLVAAGVTGSGGYLGAYDIVDLAPAPYTVRSTPFVPTVIGRLKASSDARAVLLTLDSGTSSSLEWWPLAEPEKRAAVGFGGIGAEWRPGTSEIWWVDGLSPAGCRAAPCSGSQLVAFDVATGARRVAQRGTFGAALAGYRVDGSAAITASYGSATTLVLVDVTNGLTGSISLTGQLAAAVRLR
jgi:hypothetical protein